ncbi:MAG TPA: hypothetical protein VHU84_07445, partial [Lacipirellulaceae bacterium]|nr:hypothetical protein [Lacipirellulaceae bacterium]
DIFRQGAPPCKEKNVPSPCITDPKNHRFGIRIGSKQPVLEKLDSVSILPALEGHSADQHQHDYLCWEFYEQGDKQAVCWHDWKAIRMPMLTGKTALYDLATDLGEMNDVAGAHPDIVNQLEEIMTQAHVDDPNWTASK